MKYSWLIIVLLTLLYSCQKDELDPVVDTSDDKIVEKLIGPGGGSIIKDSIQIFIPAGSFDTEYQLELLLTEDLTDDPSRVSKSYLIKGIPDNFTIPIKIGIAYRVTPENKSFLSAGHPSFDSENSEEELFFDLLPAIDSVNFLWGEYSSPFMENGSGKKPGNAESSNLDLYLWSVSFMDVYETDFSRITYFVRLNLDKVKLLGDRIDSAANYFISKNLFQFTKGYQKVNVLIRSTGKENPEIRYHNPFIYELTELGTFETLNRSLHLSKHTFVNIDMDKFNTYQENYIQMIAGESVYRYLHALFLCEPDDWLEWALVYRFKKIFMNDDSAWEELYFLPEYYEQPFIGIGSGINEKGSPYDINLAHKKHGASVSLLLDYLFKHYDTDVDTVLLHRLYSYEMEDPENPLTNLIHAVPAEVEAWWPDYFKHFLQGDILTDAPKKCIDRITWNNEFYFMDESDTVKFFQNIYTAISGETGRINYSLDGFKEGESLRIQNISESSINDNVRILIFAQQNDELEFLVGGNDISISNVKEIVDRGVASLLVLVVNSTIPVNNYAQYNIEVEIRKEKSQETEWPWKYVNINFENLTAIYELDNGDNYETTASFSHYVQNCTFSATESAFYSSWDTSYSSGITAYAKKVDLYIKVDTLSYDVISFEVTNLSEYFYDGKLETRHESSINGGMVPASSHDPDYLTNQKEGSSACATVQSFEHTYTEKPGTDYQKTMVLKSYDCTEDSYLQIRWKKEHLVW